MNLVIESNRITLALDSSNIQSYLTCPRMWHFKYVNNYRKVRPKKALDLGTFTHYLLELYYRNPGKLQEILGEVIHAKQVGSIEPLVEAFSTLPAGYQKDPGDPEFPVLELEPSEYLELCSKMQMYSEYYSGRDFKLAVKDGVKGAEVGFAINLFSGEIEGVDRPVDFIFEGRIDLLVELVLNGSPLCWVDHKTQQRKVDLYGKKIQFRGYDLALNHENDNFGYGMINYFGLQKSTTKPNERFRRELINFSPVARVEFKKFLIEKVFTPIVKNPVGFRDPNFGSCSGAFESHPCDFVSACESPNPTLTLIQNFVEVEPWRPW